MTRLNHKAIEARTHSMLNSLIRIGYLVASWREHIDGWAEQSELSFDTMDGMIDYNRYHFNRLDSTVKQDAYMKRLRVKTYYTINDTIVPKLVYDHYKGLAEGTTSLA